MTVLYVPQNLVLTVLYVPSLPDSGWGLPQQRRAADSSPKRLGQQKHWVRLIPKLDWARRRGWHLSSEELDVAIAASRRRGSHLFFFFFFFTLVTGPRRSLSLKLSETRVYEPQIRARLGTSAAKSLMLRSQHPIKYHEIQLRGTGVRL